MSSFFRKRRARCDSQLRNLRQSVDQLFGKPIADRIISRIAAYVEKRRHGDPGNRVRPSRWPFHTKEPRAVFARTEAEIVEAASLIFGAGGCVT